MLSGHRHQLQVQQGLQHRRRRAFAAFPGARGSRRTPGLEHEMTDPFTAKLRDAQQVNEVLKHLQQNGPKHDPDDRALRRRGAKSRLERQRRWRRVRKRYRASSAESRAYTWQGRSMKAPLPRRKLRRAGANPREARGFLVLAHRVKVAAEYANFGHANTNTIRLRAGFCRMTRL